MTIQHEIASLQARLTEFGISIGEMLAEAHIDRSMWTRWRRGATVPRLDNWYAARDAAERLIAARVRNAKVAAPAGEAQP
ncbi:hypothetical protein [Xanthobacter aminoxidans]|uniref:XRE family transcriptional regulator n=1 Tax=Xanthobacter aminoxidans TaxID=186280 RepID=A0ABW6ZC68_9HYPH